MTERRLLTLRNALVALWFIGMAIGISWASTPDFLR